MASVSEFTIHDWRWVCNALASPRFPAPHLPLVDTVIIDRGRPCLWLCLQRDGTVQQKPVNSSSSQEILNAFTAFSLGYPRNKAHMACTVHYAVGLPQVRSKIVEVFFYTSLPSPHPSPPPCDPLTNHHPSFFTNSHSFWTKVPWLQT